MTADSSVPSMTFQCVSADPLFNAPVKLLIHDVLHGLTPIAANKTMFLYKTHPVNQAEVVGVVTSLKHKGDVLQCSLDDGTGSIECFCPFHERPEVDDALLLLVSERTRERLRPQCRAMKLGDVLRVSGWIKQGLWSNRMYLSNCKWSSLRKPNDDELWLKHFQEVAELRDNVYSKPFCLNEKLQDASKSLLLHEIYTNLCKTFQPVVEDIVCTSKYNHDNFFGFELLELADIQKIVQSVLTEPRANGPTLHTSVLTNQDKKHVAANALASVLHVHVAEGRLLKQKSLAHQAVTNNDQIDSRYFVTTKCRPILQGVQAAMAKNEADGKSSFSAWAVLKDLDAAEFSFFKSSKHAVNVVKTAMENIKRNVFSENKRK